MLTQTSLLALAAFAAAAPVENIVKRDTSIKFTKGIAQGKLGGQTVNFTLDTTGDFAIVHKEKTGKETALQTLITSGYTPDKSSTASTYGDKYEIEISPYAHVPDLETGVFYKDTLEFAGNTFKDYFLYYISDYGTSSTSYNPLDLSFNGTFFERLDESQIQFTTSVASNGYDVNTDVNIGSFDGPGKFHKVNEDNTIENVAFTFEDRSSQAFKAVLDFASAETSVPRSFRDSFPFVGFEGGGVLCNATSNLQVTLDSFSAKSQGFTLPTSALVGSSVSPTVCNSNFEEADGYISTVHLGANILQYLVVTYDKEKGGVWVKEK